MSQCRQPTGNYNIMMTKAIGTMMPMVKPQGAQTIDGQTFIRIMVNKLKVDWLNQMVSGPLL
ncbi:MAG: hypothetical protein ACLT8V_00130 [Streptococcus salivarius]